MLEKQTEKCVMRVNWNCSCSESFLKRLPVIFFINRSRAKPIHYIYNMTHYTKGMNSQEC